MLYIVIVSVLFFSSLIYIIYPPVASNFPTWTDKVSVIQTHFTIIGVIVGIRGIYEVINKIKKRYNPILLINGQEKILNLSNDKFPQSIKLAFFVFNKGNISLPKDDARYTILFPNELYPINFIDGINTPDGNKVIPKVLNYSRSGILAISGEVTLKIYPRRKMRIFTAKVNFPKEGEYIIKYYFSTDIGFFPNKIIADFNNEPLKNLGEIKIIVTKV